MIIVEGVVERLERLEEEVEGLGEEGAVEGVAGRDMVEVVMVDIERSDGLGGCVEESEE